MKCEPIYGVEDERSLRPSDVKESRASYTYYLFDNADLLHYRVRLTHNGPEPMEIGELDWPDGLTMEAQRDGEGMETGTVTLEPLGYAVVDTRYYLGGEPVENLQFVRRPSGRGSDPLQSYDDLREERREVETLPTSIATYQSLVAEFRIVDGEGAPLAPGNYRVSFRDAKKGLGCEWPQLLVLRPAETQLDRVDEYIVRYRHALGEGDREGADDALRLATEVAPQNLKAWYFRGAHAHATGDLEGHLAALERQQLILRERRQDTEAISESVRVLARGYLSEIEDLRAKVEAARAAEGRDLTSPDL
ncbi:MAG: hypothetical protein AAGD06_29695 [Acidobacteriota bacterium]